MRLSFLAKIPLVFFLADPGLSDPKFAYRFVPIHKEIKKRCQEEANKIFCIDKKTEESDEFFLSELNGFAASCDLKQPSGLQFRTPCNPRDPESSPKKNKCWEWQKTGEECYDDKNECKKPKENSCAFYSNCLEKYHQCGEDGYAIQYGQKYCYAFRGLELKSDIGKGWLKTTMQCLQESLVKYLDEKASENTCQDLKKDAFSSHVDCYTQKDHSICDLSLKENMSVIDVVEIKDFFTKDSARQVTAVFWICLKSHAGFISLDDKNDADEEEKVKFWKKKIEGWEKEYGPFDK